MVSLLRVLQLLFDSARARSPSGEPRKSMASLALRQRFRPPRRAEAYVLNGHAHYAPAAGRAGPLRRRTCAPASKARHRDRSCGRSCAVRRSGCNAPRRICRRGGRVAGWRRRRWICRCGQGRRGAGSGGQSPIRFMGLIGHD